MSKQGARTILLAVGTATVVGLSIYLSHKQRFSSGVTGRPGAPSRSDLADPTGAEPAAEGWARPRIGDVRDKVHGWTGALARVPERLTDERAQLVSGLKLGKASRHLSDVAVVPETHEPTAPVPPPSRT